MSSSMRRYSDPKARCVVLTSWIHWRFAQSSDDKCEKAVCMSTEYADLRPETDNWKYNEKDSSEDVYHVIEKQGREVVLNKSYYGQQYGGGVCNYVTWLYAMLDMPTAAVYVALPVGSAGIMESARPATEAYSRNAGHRNCYNIVKYPVS
ncbi:hypothetical protein DL770_000945 [Monosporascus sp. CRB-9-2]|nr:hypothetical protein DL770_000945 [Monosporascus sp. CRB-9-2]